MSRKKESKLKEKFLNKGYIKPKLDFNDLFKEIWKDKMYDVLIRKDNPFIKKLTRNPKNDSI